MDLDEYVFFLRFYAFYSYYMPFVLFVLCYLLFKQQPSKKAYIHFAIVIFLLTFKHWAMLIDIGLTAEDMGIFLDEDWIIQNYFWQSLLTALFGVFILALMHRPVNIGYDKILKKEIWGVWYQENNGTEYFTKRDQQLSQQGKDNE